MQQFQKTKSTKAVLVGKYMKHQNVARVTVLMRRSQATGLAPISFMAFLRKGKARQGSLVIIGWKRYWYLCTCSTREMAMSSSRPLLLRSWSREQNKFSLSNKIFLKCSERVASVSCKACKIPEICQTFSMLAILKIRALCHSFAHVLREERSRDW